MNWPFGQICNAGCCTPNHSLQPTRLPRVNPLRMLLPGGYARTGSSPHQVRGAGEAVRRRDVRHRIDPGSKATAVVSEMPTLATKRLLLRPFEMEDLPDVHRLLDIELRPPNLGSEKMDTLEERAEWLKWTVLSYSQLAKLHQPPFGDRAVILRSAALFIGACGFVPCLNPFEQLPSLAPAGASAGESRYTTEFGLFYAISPAHQRQGYATEAAQALVDYAFQHLVLKRILATTEYDNAASIGVMRKLGMKIDRNPRSQPPWLQAVGILENEYHAA